MNSMPPFVLGDFLRTFPATLADIWLGLLMFTVLTLIPLALVARASRKRDARKAEEESRRRLARIAATQYHRETR